jgi:hypothetical protein
MTSGAAAASDPRSQRFLIVLTALAAIQVALFFWYLSATIIRQPYWDMYSWVLHYLDFRAHGDWWSYLWSSHDVHRPVWIRLLTALDIEWFRGVSYPFIVSTTVGHLVTAWLLWRETRAGVAGAPGAATGLIVVMLLFSSVAAVNCAVPITNGYLHVVTFVVAAIVLYDNDGADRDGQGGLWRRVCALLLAMGAPLASGVGVAVWPILLFISWRRGEGRWTAIVATVGAVFLAAYMSGLTNAIHLAASAESVNPASVFQERANYLLTFLGLPWTRSATLSVLGRVAGFVFLVAGVWMVLRGLTRRPASRLERLALGLVMFSLASAAMATLGRVDQAGRDDVLVPVRYAVLMTPLHVGLLWIASPVVVRLWNERDRWSRVAGAFACGGLLLLAQQVAAGQIAVATADHMRDTIARFVAGETDAGMADVIYPDLDQARRELTTIREAGLYLNAR